MISQYISLTELQTCIRATLAERFAEPVWVSAEIADIKINSSGHCYLELIEKGVSDGAARAQARGVIWRSAYMRIAGRFEAESGQRLASGIRILIRAAINYHELYGLSLQIVDIDPSYTLGDMERRKQETIAQLKRDGVWDMNREVPMPAIVQRIAVVSSSGAAGFQDFRNELSKSEYRFSLTLFDSVMQGAASEESIIAALELIAEADGQFDAAVIIRGGGAVSDLNCFNSYRLTSHVAQFPLPVITGIGHDKDVSIVDMVAHTALKTPTAVAAWLDERSARIDGALDNAALQLRDLCIAVTHSHELRLERALNRLDSDTRTLLAKQAQRLAASADTLERDVRSALTRQRTRLDNMGELAESRSPQRILRLGFAVARLGGRALTSAKSTCKGDRLTIELADGEIITEVKVVSPTAH